MRAVKTSVKLLLGPSLRWWGRLLSTQIAIVVVSPHHPILDSIMGLTSTDTTEDLLGFNEYY